MRDLFNSDNTVYGLTLVRIEDFSLEKEDKFEKILKNINTREVDLR